MRTAPLALALALAGCAWPLAARPAPYVLQPGHIDLERGPDGNTVILDTADGLVVVDTGRHPEHSARILEHARAVGKPVIAIVNTHWHLDHTTGNRDIHAVFPLARIVATSAIAGALEGFLARSAEQARARIADPATGEAERANLNRALAAIADQAALLPSAPTDSNGPMMLGDRTFELRVAPHAATEADLWLLVPDERLAIVGDLVVAQFPFFDTGCEEGWRAALDEIAKAEWTTLIPGHGAPMDRAAFGRWRLAFANLLDCAKSDRAAADCSAGWERDAAGFYSEAERAAVRMMGVYYVAEVLRAPPAQRMAYCTAE